METTAVDATNSGHAVKVVEKMFVGAELTQDVGRGQ